MSKRSGDLNEKPYGKQPQLLDGMEDKAGESDNNSMGEFEDPFEDELESEEEFLVDDDKMGDDNEEGDEVLEVDNEGEEEVEPDVQVYLPGQELKEGEKLEVDNSAYVMLHSMNITWPCLSFDIVPDPLGNNRTKFPMTTYLAAGTQADKPNNNEVLVMKLSQLCKTKYDGAEDEDMSDDDDDDTEDDPILEHKSIKHFGGINRIRVTSHENSTLAATWADTGKVHIFDLQPHLTALDVPGHVIPEKAQKPLFTLESHTDEGFAMDWSIINPGRLLTGDFNKRIYLTTVTNNGVVPDRLPFTGHSSSIEDLQWSPSEKNVFASCSADQTVKVWDVRNKKSPGLSIQAHQADVNVISWNKSVNYLLASGSDDGNFAVWDLRTFSNQKTPQPVAQFKWHTAPITSIEWHPTEESVLAVAGADDQISLWDLSVEPDEEDPNHFNLNQSNGTVVPPQLLFVHQGQSDIKELHWHPQIPGCVISTALSGFNVFKTISI